ncbi:AMP-binding protein [Motiliproteus sediminis]|uniref:AMP-binding protein n=1 Tax=Motiliproteus sediminis TaxID=1468178 RepID=UPI001AEFB8F8|nr:AMP-binding protein [Motiliproteus sediminis]
MMADDGNLNLCSNLYRHALKHPEAVALSIAGCQFSYGELATAVCDQVRTLTDRVETGSRVVVVGRRSVSAYVGTLAVAWLGGTYIPLLSRYPDAYIAPLLERLQPTLILADSAAECSRLAGLTSRPVRQIAEPAQVYTPAEGLMPPAAVAPDGLAYMVFTSGTTGLPKVVAPTYSNVTHFCRGMQQRFQFTASDRFGQYVELDFDPSVINLFCAFAVGASCWVMSETEVLLPWSYLTRNEVTVLYCMPSLAALAMRDGIALPALKHTLFGGETLTPTIAERWRTVAPQSSVHNYFGPTETLVACSSFHYQEPTAVTPERNSVPVGFPLPGVVMRVVDSALQPCNDGESGEILVSGPQVISGYWRDEERSRDAFVCLDDSDLRWYRSGDLGYRDRSGCFHFLGRIDNQIQLRGMRVEIDHIEAVARRCSGCEQVAVIPWPVVDSRVEGLALFLEGEPAPRAALITALTEELPRAQIPSVIRWLSPLPKSRTGKVDRKQLASHLAAPRPTDS